MSRDDQTIRAVVFGVPTAVYVQAGSAREYAARRGEVVGGVR